MEAERQTINLRIARTLVALFFASVLILAILLIRAYQDPKDPGGLPIITYVMLAAALGSSIDLSSGTNRLLDGSRHRDIVVALCWKLLVSIVLAILVYIVFAAGILQGALFPKFDKGDAAYANMLELMNVLKPVTNADAVKAVIWSFVAGYSERFVPNILADMETRAGSSEESYSDATVVSLKSKPTEVALEMDEEAAEATLPARDLDTSADGAGQRLTEMSIVPQAGKRTASEAPTVKRTTAPS